VRTDAWGVEAMKGRSLATWLLTSSACDHVRPSSVLRRTTDPSTPVPVESLTSLGLAIADISKVPSAVWVKSTSLPCCAMPPLMRKCLPSSSETQTHWAVTDDGLRVAQSHCWN
jgi:hypothetical protein